MTVFVIKEFQLIVDRSALLKLDFFRKTEWAWLALEQYALYEYSDGFYRGFIESYCRKELAHAARHHF